MTAKLFGTTEKTSELNTDEQIPQTRLFGQTITILPCHQPFCVIVARDAPLLLLSLLLKEPVWLSPGTNIIRIAVGTIDDDAIKRRAQTVGHCHIRPKGQLTWLKV